MNKEEISAWLDKYEIKDYLINDDLTVDVDGAVYLHQKKLTSIPVQFGTVESFICCDNQLTSLKGCPHTVNNLFNCSHNKLTSLEFGPTFVGISYGCAHNLLTSLKGIGNSLSCDLNCSHNQLISLDYLPNIQINLNCSHNSLTSLQGCPKKYLGILDCSFNQLTSLEGAPEVIFQFNCDNNALTSLKGSIVEIQYEFNCDNNPIRSLEGCTTTIGNKFLHKLTTNNNHDLIAEFKDLYTFNLPNNFTLDVTATQFNAFTQSQRLDKILPHKKNSITKSKI